MTEGYLLGHEGTKTRSFFGRGFELGHAGTKTQSFVKIFVSWCLRGESYVE
jgi:hypothetical protein